MLITILEFHVLLGVPCCYFVIPKVSIVHKISMIYNKDINISWQVDEDKIVLSNLVFLLVKHVKEFRGIFILSNRTKINS